jgi:hypothetical protein
MVNEIQYNDVLIRNIMERLLNKISCSFLNSINDIIKKQLKKLTKK